MAKFSSDTLARVSPWRALFCHGRTLNQPRCLIFCTEPCKTSLMRKDRKLPCLHTKLGKRTAKSVKIKGA